MSTCLAAKATLQCSGERWPRQQTLWVCREIRKEKILTPASHQTHGAPSQRDCTSEHET